MWHLIRGHWALLLFVETQLVVIQRLRHAAVGALRKRSQDACTENSEAVVKRQIFGRQNRMEANFTTSRCSVAHGTIRFFVYITPLLPHKKFTARLQDLHSHRRDSNGHCKRLVWVLIWRGSCLVTMHPAASPCWLQQVHRNPSCISGSSMSGSSSEWYTSAHTSLSWSAFLRPNNLSRE